VIHKDAWRVPELFRMIVELGGVPQADAYRTLNMGIGLVFMVPAKQADKTLSALKKMGTTGRVLGQVEKGRKEAVLV
jgi:phosphoribosylformylglycinamidine cyclo-ligase